MSLQVWLPLTSDIGNYGLSDITFSNTSTSVIKLNTAGKIGSCFERTDTSGNALISNKIINLGTNQSMFCWINFTTLQSSSSLTGIIGQHRHSTNTGMGVTIRYVSSTTGYVSCNTGNGSSRTYNSYYGSTLLSAGNWYHIGYTYDGSTIRLYVNGNLDKEQAYTGMSTPADYLLLFNWAFSGTTGTSFSSYGSPYKLNDVRIYDHALSAKEVKEIAKGLVVHYPLSRPQENLAKNSADLTQWGKESGVTVTWDNSVQMFKITDTTHTSSRWGAYQDFNCAANTTYTYSVTGKSVDDGVYLSVGSGAPSGYPGNHGRFTATPTRMSYTFTTGANDTTIRMYLAVYPTESGSRTAYFSFPKLELGSVATPWIPASTDTAYSVMGYNNNIEYDCSGYKNNGTKNGTFAYSSNTARYNSSTIFNGSDNAIVVPFNSIFQPGVLVDYTISVWIYKTVIGSKGYQTIFGGPSGYEIEARVSSGADPKFHLHSWGGGQTPYEFNKWTHVCFVHSTTEVKLYVNGELKISGGTPKGNPTGTYFVGAWNSATQQNFEGQMTDFRIYVTALSAEAIKELYDTPVSIANNGAMLTQGEFVES